MSIKKRLEMEVSKEQAVEFIRSLATCLEEGKQTFEPYDLDLSSFKNIKLSLKPTLIDGFKVKMKVKLSDLEVDDEEYQLVVGKEKYKDIKKKMEKYFQEIKESISWNQLPSREIVSVFVRHSEAMTEFKGYGDPFYPEYMDKCYKLKESFDQENFAEFKNAYYALENLKDRCHSKYK